MPTINDYKKATFRNLDLSGTLQDQENKWLKAWVAPYTGATNDMWMKFLSDRGFTNGPISYRQNLWLASLDYTGVLPNKFYQFWKNGGGRGSSWAVGADISYDFTKTGVPAGLGPFTFTDTHAQTIYAPNAAGVYAPFTANTLVRTDLGLQTVPTRTNLAFNSQDFSGWTLVSGTTVVVDDIVAPDGTTTADRVVADGFAVNQGVNRVIDTGSTIASKTFTGSFFIYSATAFTGTVRIRGNGATQEAENFSVSVPANQWTRISGTKTFTGAADGNSVFFGFIGDFGLSIARTYWLWQGQYELGAFASAPILTTGSAVTINGNQQVISSLGTQLATGVAGLVQINPMDVTTGGQPFQINDGTAYNRLFVGLSAGALSLVLQTGGVSQATLALGTATANAVCTIAFVATNNYVMGRAVGQAAPSPDVSTPNGWPVIDRVALGGRGYATDANVYEFTRKLALDFLTPGDDPATKFAEWYAKAVLAAA